MQQNGHVRLRIAGQSLADSLAEMSGAGLSSERLVRDQAALLPLPATPYEACEKKPARVSSLSLVRYRGNDYSVSIAYGHREVLVRGYIQTEKRVALRGYAKLVELNAFAVAEVLVLDLQD